MLFSRSGVLVEAIRILFHSILFSTLLCGEQKRNNMLSRSFVEIKWFRINVNLGISFQLKNSRKTKNLTSNKKPFTRNIFFFSKSKTFYTKH